MVERAHRRLKDALRARAVGPHWFAELPWVLLWMKTAPREETGLSAAEAVYGSPLVIPGQFLAEEEAPSGDFFKELRATMSKFRPTTARHNVPAGQERSQELPLDLAQAEYVLIRRDGHSTPLAPRYDGPYKVIKRSGRYFRLLMGTREDNVAVQRLKAAYVPAGASAAVPPQRGRPRRNKHVTFSLQSPT